jgi:hypothetical protein
MQSIPEHVQRHLDDQKQSGLSIRAYCAKLSLPVWTFYGWRRKYVRPSANDSGQPQFSELGRIDLFGTVCEVHLPSGITVAVKRGVSREELSRLFEILLQSTPPC